MITTILSAEAIAVAVVSAVLWFFPVSQQDVVDARSLWSV